MDTLPHEIAALEASGPASYSRWSSIAWRHVCSGPATTLWNALATHAQKDKVLVGYLSLLHSAVGLQYIAVDPSGTIDPARTFLARAFCDTLPALLPRCDGRTGLEALAAIWNVGERLQTKAPWLDRYLAARLPALVDLKDLARFVETAIEEGLEPVRDAAFTGDAVWRVHDCAALDRRFLPGECHMATPSILCVHDRLRPEVHEALLLRPGADAVSLGATPCLGETTAFTPPPETKWKKHLAKSGLKDPSTALATASGFIVLSAIYSQRLWIGRVT